MEWFDKRSRVKRRRFCDLWAKESRKVCQVRVCRDRKKKRKNVSGLRNPSSSGLRRKLNGKLWTLCQAMKSFSYERDLSTNPLPGKVRRRFVDRKYGTIGECCTTRWKCSSSLRTVRSG